MVAYAQGDYAAAGSLYEESLAISRELGNKGPIATTMRNLGRVAYAQGDYAPAGFLYEESLAMRRELGDKGGISTSLHYMGNMALMQGSYASARSLYEESLALRSELGDKAGIAELLNSLGHLAHRQGDIAEARQLYVESLSISRKIRARQAIAVSLAGLGALLSGSTARQPAIGTTLLGAAEALLQAMGAVEDPADLAGYEQGVAAARAQLDAGAFAAAWAQGHAMSMEDAIIYAFDKTSGD
jgi:tetratricopeptide (TPR) repeat protein